VRIGVLTGGGDVPGLNPAIKATVNRAIEEGHTAVGIMRGWGGLLACDPDDPESVAHNTMDLDRNAVRTIDRYGGTMLHTSRTNPSKVRAKDAPASVAGKLSGEEPHDCTDHVLHVLERLGIDALVAIGGDDTLSYALRLHRENVPVVAVPKTMDNDVFGTDYCIGFSTAITRSVQAINNLRTSAGSHERIAVVELFGRYSGETSLISAYLAGADRSIISEVPFDVERLSGLLMEDRHDNPRNYAMCTVSEGARPEGGEMIVRGEPDPYGHQKLGGIGDQVAEYVKELTGVGVISQNLGYIMRSGAPDALDLMVATNYAVMATDLLFNGISGQMCSLREGQYTHVDIEETGRGEKRVNVDAFYDRERYVPKVRHVDGQPMFLS